METWRFKRVSRQINEQRDSGERVTQEAGLTKVSLIGVKKNGFFAFDAGGELVLAMLCERRADMCTIAAKRESYTVTSELPFGSPSSIETAETRADDLIALLKSWRCPENGCSGALDAAQDRFKLEWLPH